MQSAPLWNSDSGNIRIDDDEESPRRRTRWISAEYFVTQHYYDFLSRVPDSGGFAVLDQPDCRPPPCPNGDQVCLLGRRITVSNASSLRLEYQQTVPLVYRLYRWLFGNQQPFPNPIPDRNFRTMIRKWAQLRGLLKRSCQGVGGADLAQAQLSLAKRVRAATVVPEKIPASLATLPISLSMRCWLRSK